MILNIKDFNKNVLDLYIWAHKRSQIKISSSYKVLDLVKLYNFDIIFCLHLVLFKNDINLFMLQLLLKLISKDS
jgi:hypothetical protein